MKKFISSVVAGAFLLGTALPVFAQTQSTADLIKQLQNQIAALKAQIEVLQQAQQGVQTAQEDVQGTLKLLRHMRQGMSGEDVTLLQTTLAGDSNVYPEGLITGFFGRLTEKAVKRFQEKHSLEQVGNVGPRTLKKLNEFLGEHPLFRNDDEDEDEDDDDRPNHPEKPRKPELCAVVPPGHLIAPGWLRKIGNDKPIVLPCQILPPGVGKKIPPSATTTPPAPPPVGDVTPPVISAITAGAIASTSAMINWTTNEVASSKVYYSLAAAIDVSTDPRVSDASLLTSHALMLSALTASTTYYYLVESKDAANNVATSGVQSFVTLPAVVVPPPDVTPPVISGTAVSAIVATSATISWTTNEPSTSKVYYGTTTPVNLATASAMSDSILLTSHALVLSGLTASTTYYYILESKDGANNGAQTDEQSFTTL